MKQVREKGRNAREKGTKGKGKETMKVKGSNKCKIGKKYDKKGMTGANKRMSERGNILFSEGRGEKHCIRIKI